MHEPFPPGAPMPQPHYTLQKGDVPAAKINLARAEDAAMRCVDLLRHMPPVG